MGQQGREQPITLHFMRWMCRSTGIAEDAPQLLATPIVECVLVSGRRSIYYQRHSSPQGHFQSTLNHLVLLEAFVPHEIR